VRTILALLLILFGIGDRETAKKLFISVETVKKHVSNIYRKLGVQNHVQLSNFVPNRLRPPQGDL
jgi:DNA-binding CsgD family transcriptional regulator